MVFQCCLQEWWRRMLYPWGCNPQRRDSWMFLKCWLFPHVRYTPFTQGPTSLVTLLKAEPLSSHQLFWCLLGSSQTHLLLWDFPQELTLEQAALCGMKAQALFLQMDPLATKICGFWVKAQPKGLYRTGLSDAPGLGEGCTMGGYLHLLRTPSWSGSVPLCMKDSL